jgi:hypothetical protein
MKRSGSAWAFLLVGVMVLIFLSGCSGGQVGQPLSPGDEVHEAAVVTKGGLPYCNLRSGWNLITYSLPSSSRFSGMSMQYGEEGRLLGDAATSGWTSGQVRFLKGRAWVLLQCANGNNVMQKGMRYYVWSFRNGVVLYFNRPFISGMTPRSATPEDLPSSATITGVNFGAVAGLVTFYSGKAAGITSWSDTRIVCDIPADADTGPVVVTAGGQASNPVRFGVSGYFFRTWGGPSWDDAYGVAADRDGNIYSMGQTQSFGVANGDVFVLKYDRAGNLKWKKTWGGAIHEMCYGIAVDSAGNAYLAGYSASFKENENVLVLLKYDPSGNLLWQKLYESNGSNYGFSIKLDRDGNIYIGGQTTYSGVNGGDSLLMKYDRGGNKIWAVTWDFDTWDSISDITLDRNGNIIALVNMYSDATNLNRVAILKLDGSGNVLLKKTWTSDSSYPGGVVTDSENNIYLTAEAYDSEADKSKFCLVKYDSTFNLIWQKSWTAMQYSCVYKIAIDSDDKLYTTGDTYENNGLDYMVLLKYDKNGNLLLQEKYAGSSYSIGNNLFIDEVNNLYIAGSIHSPANFWDSMNETVGIPSGTEEIPAADGTAHAGTGRTMEGTQTSPGGYEFFAGASDALLIRIPSKGLSTLRLDGAVPFYGKAGDQVTLRGFNFGVSQGGSQIVMGEIDCGEASSWSNTEIVFTVPGGIEGLQSLYVSVNGKKTNTAHFNISRSYYVDVNGGSDDNPGTVEQPYRTLTKALDMSSYGDVVYIAQGTYAPSGGETFPLAMKDQVKLKGGYNSGFTSRDLVDNRTVLDAEQTTRIFKLDSTSSGTEFEALTLTNGKNPDAWGGAINAGSSSFSMKYCTVMNSSGGDYGAGMYCSACHIVMENCIFRDNYGTVAGGAIYAWECGINMTNCLILNNRANIYGGVCFSYNCEPVVTNCLFVNNVGTNGNGGALSFYSTTALVNGCNFIGNSSNMAGGIYTENNAVPTIRYCDFYNNTQYVAYNSTTGTSGDTTSFSAWGWDGTGCLEVAPQFVDEVGGDYHLQAGSPLIDAGDPLYGGYLLDGSWETVHGVPDVSPVDMGCHFPYVLIQQ